MSFEIIRPAEFETVYDALDYIAKANAEIERLQAALDDANKLCDYKQSVIAQLVSDVRGDGWISVEERLPEKVGQYIVFDGKNVRDGSFMSSHQFWCSEVTHWQPLPAPPQSPQRRYTIKVPNLSAADIAELDPDKAREIVELGRELEGLKE